MKRMVSILCVLLILGACISISDSTPRVSTTLGVSTGIEPNEAAVFVTAAHDTTALYQFTSNGIKWNTRPKDDVDFSSCISKRISNVNSDIKIIPSKEFRDAVSPWAELKNVPNKPEGLNEWLKTSLVQSKIQEFGIRYVIHLIGRKWITSWTGGGYGSLWYEEENRIDVLASVWDVKVNDYVGTINESADGSVGGGFYIVPFFSYADAEDAICNDLGEKLAKVISGEELQETQAIESPSETSEPPPELPPYPYIRW